MNRTILHAALALAFLTIPVALVATWVYQADTRLVENDAAVSQPQAAVAAASDTEYCSAVLKRVLRRVVQSCGLLSGGEVRGCQPLAAKAITSMAGDDFNALFMPLAERAAIIQFDKDSDQVDDPGAQALDAEFADQRGASYFLVVARASPEGDPVYNRDLSQRRGNATLDHLRQKFQDPDLDHEVGLLWLGADSQAQLDEQFCSWKRSRGGECTPADLNRSAFVTWIDCTL
jgi:outer membrane protein OmpA-like peptidoglycan-associated protein